MDEYMRLDSGSCLVTCGLKSETIGGKYRQGLLSIPKTHGLTIHVVGSWLMSGYMQSKFQF